MFGRFWFIASLLYSEYINLLFVNVHSFGPESFRRLCLSLGFKIVVVVVVVVTALSPSWSNLIIYGFAWFIPLELTMTSPSEKQAFPCKWRVCLMVEK